MGLPCRLDIRYGLQQHPNIWEEQLAQFSAKGNQTVPYIKPKSAKRQQTLVMDLKRPAESQNVQGCSPGMGCHAILKLVKSQDEDSILGFS